jgi:hypothetical protein
VNPKKSWQHEAATSLEIFDGPGITNTFGVGDWPRLIHGHGRLIEAAY